ncbi:MAG: polysaccharide deacetylase family protein [Proteobacteria bacterium]|nr:polysaccharide deacetylase family protein [Pseudomonadota bacterium]
MPWDRLGRELDLWAEAGMTATLWWRDDDAERPGPELERLLDLALAHDLSPALAVIPAGAEDALALAVERLPGVAVLQHGYAHRNHAPAGAKKAELGGERPLEVVDAELVSGRQRLSRLFAERFLPALVPPWNRIAADLVSRLPRLGFRGLSTYGGRGRACPQVDLLQVNTHIDPVDWSARRFLGVEQALALAVQHLADRRLGRLERSEPTGLLTHHLMHDDDTWRFIEAFLLRTSRHRAARWLAPNAVFEVDAKVMVA